MDVEAALDDLAAAVAAQPGVQAIGLAGGLRPLPQPGEADLDLFIYCTAIPAPDTRAQALSRIAADQVTVGRLAGGHWGIGDACWLAGVETWLMYFTMDEARQELEAILSGAFLDRLDGYYYPLGRGAMYRQMRTLYDPQGFLADLRRHVEVYPQPLAQAGFQYHLACLDDREDLERAVSRQDVLFYHFALDLALDHYLQALFALNHTFFPSRKRSLEHLAQFERQPARCSARLLEVVRLGSRPETLGQSYGAFSELVDDLNGMRL